MAAKEPGSLWKVLIHQANRSLFKKNEIVRFIGNRTGSDDDNRYQHLDGSTWWYLRDTDVRSHRLRLKGPAKEKGCANTVTYICLRQKGHEGPCAMEIK